MNTKTNTTILRRVNAEGYTLAEVIEACTRHASLAASDGSFDGFPGALSSLEMAREIHGFVSYHGGYMYPGEKWTLNGSKEALRRFGEERWSRPGVSVEPTGSVEELAQLLRRLPMGSTLERG